MGLFPGVGCLCLARWLLVVFLRSLLVGLWLTRCLRVLPLLLGGLLCMPSELVGVRPPLVVVPALGLRLGGIGRRPCRLLVLALLLLPGFALLGGRFLLVA